LAIAFWLFAGLADDTRASDAAYGCIGDCDRDGAVTVDELLRGVRVALALAPQSTCPNGGRGIFIEGLVRSVRNALAGCTTIRDFSAFHTFSYQLDPHAGGFCPDLGRLGSLALTPHADGLMLSATRIAPAAPLSAQCDGHTSDEACYMRRREPCRLLTVEEIQRVRDGFANVTTFGEADAQCLHGVSDPCSRAVFTWDGRSFDDHLHARHHVDWVERRRLGTLLDSLGAGPVVECPPAAPADRHVTIEADIMIQMAWLALPLSLTHELIVHTAGNGPDEADIRLSAVRERLALPPIAVFRLFCACAALREQFEFQADIACRDDATGPVTLRIRRDHNVTPGSPGNRGGLPDDPACGFGPLPPGHVSDPCREGEGITCRSESSLHDGVCNSGVVVDAIEDVVPRGSALLATEVRLGVLNDGGACAAGARRPDGQCPFADYGPDCLPCTNDDAGFVTFAPIRLTTGRAEGLLYDLHNGADPEATVISADQECFGIPCDTVRDGTPFDCDRLGESPDRGVDGVLVGALPLLDLPGTGDAVVMFRVTLR
jgi:hypothetical protein